MILPVGKPYPQTSWPEFDIFFRSCQWAFDAWFFYKKLIQDNPRIDEMVDTRNENFFAIIGTILKEYSLLQITKLHDSATQGANKNVTFSYILNKRRWLADKELNDLKKEMDSFADKIRPARHKILVHNDLKTAQDKKVLGAFDVGEDERYFERVERFLEICFNELAPKEIFLPFNTLLENDCNAFISQFLRGKPQ